MNEFDQLTLHSSMQKCGMSAYPEVVGDPQGERCSGQMVCEICGNEYRQHPMDWRPEVIGYGNAAYLNVTCDGRRVKL